MRIITHAIGGNDAALTCYLLDNGLVYSNIQTRLAMLIFPGGGYAVCSDREAEPNAMAYH